MEIINDESVEDTEELLLILTPRSTGCKLFGDLHLSGTLYLKIISNPANGEYCAIKALTFDLYQLLSYSDKSIV